jgi:glycosyltransferase involved in cell wall biosynthesis
MSTASFDLLHVLGDGRVGGGAMVVLDLSRHLAASGIPVTIASTSNSYVLGEATKSGIGTLELDFSSRLKSGMLSLQLARHLRAASRPVVLHAHGVRACLPVAMLPASQRPAIVYTVHGFHFWDKPPVIRTFAELSEKFCIARSSQTVFVSHGDRQTAERKSLLGTNPHSVIYNACAAVSPAAIKEFDIVFLGRLVAQKNPLILLDVLKALHPLRPALCVIGDGEAKTLMHQRAKVLGVSDQVTFFGRLERAEAVARMATARILVLPSVWEGLPVSVIEAMHAGMPVVASDVPGTNELVVDGETGFLVGVDDLAAYIDRVGRLLRNQGLQREMGGRAMARARQIFALDLQAASYAAIYCRVLQNRDVGN